MSESISDDTRPEKKPRVHVSDEASAAMPEIPAVASICGEILGDSGQLSEVDSDGISEFEWEQFEGRMYRFNYNIDDTAGWRRDVIQKLSEFPSVAADRRSDLVAQFDAIRKAVDRAQTEVLLQFDKKMKHARKLLEIEAEAAEVREMQGKAMARICEDVESSMDRERLETVSNCLFQVVHLADEEVSSWNGGSAADALFPELIGPLPFRMGDVCAQIITCHSELMCTLLDPFAASISCGAVMKPIPNQAVSTLLSTDLQLRSLSYTPISQAMFSIANGREYNVRALADSGALEIIRARQPTLSKSIPDSILKAEVLAWLKVMKLTPPAVSTPTECTAALAVAETIGGAMQTSKDDVLVVNTGLRAMRMFCSRPAVVHNVHQGKFVEALKVIGNVVSGHKDSVKTMRLFCELMSNLASNTPVTTALCNHGGAADLIVAAIETVKCSSPVGFKWSLSKLFDLVLGTVCAVLKTGASSANQLVRHSLIPSLYSLLLEAKQRAELSSIERWIRASDLLLDVSPESAGGIVTSGLLGLFVERATIEDRRFCNESNNLLRFYGKLVRTCPDVVVPLVQLGGLSEVLNCFRDMRSNNPSVFTGDPCRPTVSAVYEFLAAVVTNTALHEVLFASGCIEMLLSSFPALLPVQFIADGLDLIGMLASYAGAGPVLANSSAVDMILPTMLRAVVDENVQLSGWNAIGKLALHPGMRAEVLNSPLLPALTAASLSDKVIVALVNAFAMLSEIRAVRTRAIASLYCTAHVRADLDARESPGPMQHVVDAIINTGFHHKMLATAAGPVRITPSVLLGLSVVLSCSDEKRRCTLASTWPVAQRLVASLSSLAPRDHQSLSKLLCYMLVDTQHSDVPESVLHEIGGFVVKEVGLLQQARRLDESVTQYVCMALALVVKALDQLPYVRDRDKLEGFACMLADLAPLLPGRDFSAPLLNFVQQRCEKST